VGASAAGDGTLREAAREWQLRRSLLFHLRRPGSRQARGAQARQGNCEQRHRPDAAAHAALSRRGGGVFDCRAVPAPSHHRPGDRAADPAGERCVDGTDRPAVHRDAAAVPVGLSTLYPLQDRGQAAQIPHRPRGRMAAVALCRPGRRHLAGDADLLWANVAARPDRGAAELRRYRWLQPDQHL
jgi:hypothetical protein